MSRKFVWNRNRISSIFTLLFALAILWQGSKIVAAFTSVGGSDVGSAFFPNAIAVIMLVCSIGKFLTSNKPDETPFVGGKTGWLRVLIVLAILSLYVAGLTYVGFLLSTFVACLLLVAAMKMGNSFKWLHVLAFSAVVTALLYVLFGFVLKVWLPTGLLWDLL